MFGDDTTLKDQIPAEVISAETQLAQPESVVAVAIQEQQPTLEKLQKTLATGDSPEFRWYVVHSLTGQ